MTTAFDPRQGSTARVHGYWLGGKDNYPAGRAAGEAVEMIPLSAAVVCTGEPAFPGPCRKPGSIAPLRRTFPRTHDEKDGA